MKKYKKLDKSLSQVKKWSEDAISSSNEQRYLYGEDALLDYINLGEGSTSRAIGKRSTGAHITLGKIVFLNIGESLLFAGEGDVENAITSMQIAGSKYITYLALRLLSSRKYLRTRSIDLDEVNNIVFLTSTIGLPNLAQKFYFFMMDELKNGHIVTDGHTHFGEESLRYSAMAMTIFNDLWHLPAPDLERFALPQDPAWMNYANHWREEDVEQFSEILNEVCDLHIERIGMTQREFDSGNYEFTSPFEAVYPVEILAVLRLREQFGLQNPELTHPLLLTPYAQITSKPIDQPIEDPLLDDYLNALRKYNPELIEAWDQFEV